MKISSIEYLLLDKQFPFVLVHTDENVTGIGECFVSQPAVIKTVVEEILTPAIIGKDPVQTESRFRDMVNASESLEIGLTLNNTIGGAI